MTTSLNIWEEEYSGKLSTGDMTYPVIFKTDPAGGVYERRLYLRHDDLTGNNPSSSYGISVGGTDTSGSDESTWVQVAEDVDGLPGSYSLPGEAKSLGDVLGGEIKPFWIKVTMPNDVQYGVRTDIKLQISGSDIEAQRTVYINADSGTHTNTYFETQTGRIYRGKGTGVSNWISDWIDVSGIDVFDTVVNDGNATLVLEYRTSTDGTETNAVAWNSDFNVIDATHDYIQYRVTFTSGIYFGTRREIYYGNTSWSGTPTVANGVEPYIGDLGSNYSIKWFGWVWFPTEGMYSLRCYADDYAMFQIDGTNYIAGGVVGNLYGSAYVTQGWHYCQFRTYEGSGGAYFYPYYTPPGASEKRLEIVDCCYQDPGSFENLTIKYRGPYSLNFDMQLFDGPDVPEIIAPEAGFDTPYFAPDLTVFVRNCDEIEWQMDSVITFDSDNLSQWKSVAINEQNNTSNSPSTLRDDGVWYWRARGLKNGMHSAWCEYSFVEILPMVTAPDIYYINENTGIDLHDPIIDDRLMYLNVNIGIAEHDPIIDDRLMYLNVNIGSGLGKVIYPIKDQTLTRKQTFPEDSRFTG